MFTGNIVSSFLLMHGYFTSEQSVYVHLWGDFYNHQYSVY